MKLRYTQKKGDLKPTMEKCEVHQKYLNQSMKMYKRVDGREQ
jgi:hypothetical protein